MEKKPNRNPKPETQTNTGGAYLPYPEQTPVYTDPPRNHIPMNAPPANSGPAMDASWRNFEQTGLISDYLLYKNQSLQGGVLFDRQDPRNRFGTDSAQFPGQKTDPAHF